MKKAVLILVLVSLLIVSVGGCFGNFALTRKVYEFNRGIGDKFVNTLVMWVMYIVPVYPIAGFVDLVLLNLIQFWTGSNPISMNDTDIEHRIYALEDRTIEVTITKNRYDIVETNNEMNAVSFVFDETDNSWYMHSQGNVFKITEEDKLFDFNGFMLATN